MTISVNHAALDLAAQDMVAKARAIHGVLERLDQDVRGDVMAWGGQAKDAYLPAKQRWDASMTSMVSHLQRTADLVHAANAEYLRTDRANAGLFEGLGGR